MTATSHAPFWFAMAIAAAAAGQARADEPPALSATFSIVGIDKDAGTCGAAVASKYPDVGHVVPYARAGVGAFCTQHHHVPDWGERALDWLEQGVRPEAVLTRLLRDDPQAEMRQLGIIDMQGRTAVHNPTAAPENSRYWAAMTGRDYCCQGNTLAGRDVVVAMARTFEDARGSLADRLVSALRAADAAGGDHRGRLAAAVRIAKRGVNGYWLELHVDHSDQAVEDLVRQYAQLQHEAKQSAPRPIAP